MDNTVQESSGIKFKREALAGFTPISKPGKYLLEVYSTISEKNRVTDDDGSKPRYIGTVKAIAADKLAQAREVFKNDEEVDIEQTNGLFMTFNVWEREGEPTKLPLKGEKIECVIDFVEPREGDSPVLRIKTPVGIQQAVTAAKLDLAAFLNPDASQQAEAHAEQTLTH